MMACSKYLSVVLFLFACHTGLAAQRFSRLEWNHFQALRESNHQPAASFDVHEENGVFGFIIPTDKLFYGDDEDAPPITIKTVESNGMSCSTVLYNYGHGLKHQVAVSWELKAGQEGDCTIDIYVAQKGTRIKIYYRK